RAVLLERSGDRAALGEHLARERELLLEHSAPRERAVVRAYQRMLAAPKTTIYRTSAPRGAQPADEPAMEEWIREVAPSAAPFVATARAGREAPAEPPRAPVDPDAVRAAEVRVTGRGLKGARQAGKIALLWLLAVFGLVAVWQLLTPEPSRL